MPGNTEISRSFSAMNTDVEVVACVPFGAKTAGEEALGRAQGLFSSVEKAISRFRPESELSRLNSAAGRTFRASEILFSVLAIAKEAAKNTDGIFDPTILPWLMEAGYDRSFEKLSGQSDDYPFHLTSRYSWKDIRLNADSSTAFIPAGCGIDLGGIGKGWTVDQASLLLRDFPGFAVDAGGDMVLGGKRADGSLWPVGVADPLNPGDNITIIDVSDCAICTSTTTRRKWQRGISTSHHLIDPRNGKPSSTDVISATVIAKSAAVAEVIAKTALILGPDAGLNFIESQPEVRGMLVLEDGSLLRSYGFQEAECVC